jgi:hypothetical protein
LYCIAFNAINHPHSELEKKLTKDKRAKPETTLRSAIHNIHRSAKRSITASAFVQHYFCFPRDWTESFPAIQETMQRGVFFFFAFAFAWKTVEEGHGDKMGRRIFAFDGLRAPTKACGRSPCQGNRAVIEMQRARERTNRPTYLRGIGRSGHRQKERQAGGMCIVSS